ncbi:MAG: TonB-dependent receptor [Acidobacteria bacterium]|nr:TonB-dependent receptor [Acidobacteriota bacterium]
MASSIAAQTQSSVLSPQSSPPSVLSPQSSSDTITVTATRTPSRLADTPASVVVITPEALRVSAATTTDDLLRQVPGFTLFRRSGSRSANPTSLGVSLRGVGASGASRAVVLDDGIPLNDPFGGWVYWARVPRAALERVEVVRGGASDLYGSGAMGGVVQFLRRRSSVPSVVVDTSAGTQGTATTSLYAVFKKEQWSASLAGDLFTTGGAVLIEESQRGAVDRTTTARHAGGDLTIERLFGDAGRAFVRGSRFRESRNNGTPLQTNDTTISQLAAGGETMLGGSSLSVRAYATTQHYAQTFSAIAADRASERLTVDQRVPSRGAGGSAQWSRVLDGRNALVGGVELRQVSGASEEEQFPLRGDSTFLRSFGRQRTSSAFLEDVATLGTNVSLTAGVRFDGWRNYDASRNDAPLVGRSDSAWSPRLSLLVRASDRLALTASAYRAFRAPTLNELYRGFRVGNIVTNANEALGPERLRAFELGARSGPVRVTGFWMTTGDTIANVTLSSTPALITRQRRNQGSSRSRGVEAEGEWVFASAWRLSAGWLFTDATTSTGKRVPQVARNQATLQSSYVASQATLGVQARWSSAQFDDDLNQFRLRSYFAADLFVSRPLVQGLEATLAIENLFDRRIETAATPVIALAGPRAIRLGLRFSR